MCVLVRWGFLVIFFLSTRCLETGPKTHAGGGSAAIRGSRSGRAAAKELQSRSVGSDGGRLRSGGREERRRPVKGRWNKGEEAEAAECSGGANRPGRQKLGRLRVIVRAAPGARRGEAPSCVRALHSSSLLPRPQGHRPQRRTISAQSPRSCPICRAGDCGEVAFGAVSQAASA